MPFSERFTALAPVEGEEHRPDAATGRHRRCRSRAHRRSRRQRRRRRKRRDLPRARSRRDRRRVGRARAGGTGAARDSSASTPSGLTDIVVTRASHAISPEDIEARVVRALAGRTRATDAASLALTFDSELRTLHITPGAESRIARLTFDPRTGRFDVFFELPGHARKFMRFDRRLCGDVRSRRALAPARCRRSDARARASPAPMPRPLKRRYRRGRSPPARW